MPPPTQAEIYDRATQFKDDLIANERRASARIVDSYGRAFDKMKDNIRVLTEKIEQARLSGQYISPSWAFQIDRYQALQRQIATEIGRIASQVNDATIKQQADAVKRAAGDIDDLTNMAAQNAGLSVSFSRLATNASESIVGFLSDGSPLKSLLDQLPGLAGQAVATALTDAIIRGQNPTRTASQIRAAIGGNMNRALTIARTETMRAYREASHRTLTQNGDILQGWVWVASFSRRTCASCLALAGSVHSLDERMESHPRCLLPGTTIASTANALAVTKRWTTCEAVKIRTFRGHVLTVTPNHPILTSKGWVQARCIDKSSHVVSALDSQRFFDLIDPNHNHIPSVIDQVWESFSRLPDVSRRIVPAAAENFHGDGEGGQVDIVLINSKLRSHFNSSIGQPLVKRTLVVGDIDRAHLSSNSSSNLFLFRNDANSGGSIGGFDISDIFFFCPSCHHQSISTSPISSLDFPIKQESIDARPGDIQAIGDILFRHPIDIPLSSLFRNYTNSMIGGSNAVLNESPINDSSMNTELLAQLLSGYSGLIQLDQVVDVERFTYSGHVYNLETETGWYVANGIITHNCRCIQAPLLRGQSVEFQKGDEWFASQPTEIQRAILGSNVALKAYEDGRAALLDFVGRQNSPQWGRPYYQLSTKKAILKQGQFPGYNQPTDTFSVEQLFGLPRPKPPQPLNLTNPLGGLPRK